MVDCFLNLGNAKPYLMRGYNYLESILFDAYAEELDNEAIYCCLFWVLQIIEISRFYDYKERRFNYFFIRLTKYMRNDDVDLLDRRNKYFKFYNKRYLKVNGTY